MSEEDHIMYLLVKLAEVRLGDMFVQIIFFLIIIAIAVGIVTLIKKSNKRNKQMNRMEEKMDKLNLDHKKP